MYRAKKGNSKAAAVSAATTTNPSTVVRQNDSKSQHLSPDVVLAESIIAFKNRLLAPFVLFDKTLRQVIPNPAHDRVLRAEISRVQGVVLRELRKAIGGESSSTPKEMLHAVQRSIIFAFASCAVGNDFEALDPVGSDEETAKYITRLENFFANRDACTKAIASVATVLSTGILKDTYAEVCKRLEARIAAEEKSNLDKKRTNEENSALQNTKKNMLDLNELRISMLTAFNNISSPFEEQNQKTFMKKSVTTEVTTAILTTQSYYNLLGWSLMVHPERLSLEASRSISMLGEVQEATFDTYARVTAYNPVTGKITIERSSVMSKWGLMLNPDGALVGLENALRNSTTDGGILYQALQQQPNGLTIFDINKRRIRTRYREETESEEEKAARQEKLFNMLQSPELVINLSVPKVDSILTHPQEVSFEIIPQGGEDAAGQQIALVIKRPSRDVQWHLRMRKVDDRLLLDNISSEVKLSEAAKDFFIGHRGRLHIMNVNGCDTTAEDGGFVSDVIRSSIYLIMRLQVIHDPQLVMMKESESTMDKSPLIEAQDEVLEAEQGMATPHQEILEDDDEAEVARHRALLQDHNISPDEPMPELAQPLALEEAAPQHPEEAVPVAEEGKKRGRQKKNAPELMEASEEAALQHPEEAVPVAEEGKKRDRQKKNADVGQEDKQEPEVVKDIPLVEIKSRVEIAEEVGKRVRSMKETNAAAKKEHEPIVTDPQNSSIGELLNAPPLIFENAVTLDRFDGVVTEFRRPDVRTPWDIKVSFGRQRMTMTRLPPISAALRTHPFVKHLHADASGRINWQVDAINGTDVLSGGKDVQRKAMDAVKKANKVSFVLRQIL